MRTRLFLLTVLLTATTAGSLHATNKVAVMNLKAREGIDSFLPSLINELFCAKVPEYGEYEVVTGPFIQERIETSGNDELINCNRTDCYYLIGSGFEVKFMVVGTIGMQGTAYIVNLMLLDVPNERVTRKVIRKYDGDQYGIVDELERYLQELFGVLPEQDNEDVMPEMLVEETAAPAPVYEVDDEDETYDELVSDYADEDMEMEETPSLTGDDGSIRPARKKKTKTNSAAKQPAAGAGDMFQWCDDKDRELTFSSGYSLINMGAYHAIDYLKPGYRNGRIALTLQVKFNSYQNTAFIDETEDIRADSTVSIIGGGVAFGYRLCRLFSGWVTVTPGATAGFYKYEIDVVGTEKNGTAWEPYSSFTFNDTFIGFFGGNIQVDIGHQVTDKLSLFAYVQPQLLWVKDTVFFLDFGLKLGYALQ